MLQSAIIPVDLIIFREFKAGIVKKKFYLSLRTTTTTNIRKMRQHYRNQSGARRSYRVILAQSEFLIQVRFTEHQSTDTGCAVSR